LGASLLLLTASGGAAVEPVASLVNPLDSATGSARAVAMGSAYVAEAHGADALFWNSAGLSAVEAVQLGLHHNAWLGGIIQETAVVGLPLGGLGGLGLSVNYVNYGGVPGYDENGNRQADYSANRYGVSAGWGVEILKGLSVGGSLRDSYQSIADVSYNSVAASLGVQWQLLPELRVGLAIDGLGPKVSNFNQMADISAGLSSHLHLASNNEFVFAASAAFEPGGVNRLRFGVEDLLYSFLAVRAGYQVVEADTRIGGLTGLTLGCGFLVRGLELDYAFLPFGDLGSAHRLSVAYVFGR
jgi:hypothetical protein